MSESEGEGEVIESPPPESRELPPPPDLSQIDHAFQAVRAQSSFQAARADWIAQCEHNMDALHEGLLYCNSEDPVAALPDIADRINWTIDHVSEMRAEVAAVVPPPPPPPDGTPPASLTEAQANAAARIERSLKMMSDMQLNTLLQCDQMAVTLNVAKQWCAEPDAADHLQEITNGVHGALEQMARLRSTLGSTQS
jgi:hypothetical protein